MNVKEKNTIFHTLRVLKNYSIFLSENVGNITFNLILI